MVRALAEKIRDVPNFPKEGILFKDITTLLQDAGAFRQAVDIMAETYRGKAVELVVGVESRGFIFGGALAYLLNAGFVPVRKEGKLPGQKLSEAYALEYGSANLVQQLGGRVVGISFLIELKFLKGAASLAEYNVVSHLKF